MTAPIQPKKVRSTAVPPEALADVPPEAAAWLRPYPFNPEEAAWIKQLLEEHRDKIVADVQNLVLELVQSPPSIGESASHEGDVYDEYRLDSGDGNVPATTVEFAQQYTPPANDDNDCKPNVDGSQSQSNAHMPPANAPPVRRTSTNSSGQSHLVRRSTGILALGEEMTTSNFAHAMIIRSEMQRMGAVDKKKGSRKMQNVFLHLVMTVSAWYNGIEEPRRTSYLAKVVKSNTFETTCGFVILVNSIFVAVTADWEIKNIGATLPSSLKVAEWFFVCFYILELILRLIAHRGYFFIAGDVRWNLFDTTLVLISISESVAGLVMDNEDDEKNNIVFMRILRLLKLAKILRTFRAFRFFKDLAVIAESFRSSAVAFLWAIVIFVFVLFVFALIFIQGLTQAMGSDGVDGSDRTRIVDNFGSMPLSMLTLYMSCTGGEDWARIYAVVVEAGPFYALIFVGYTFFFHFAVFNILTGLFVEKAAKASSPDKDDLVLEQRTRAIEEIKEFTVLSNILDPEGSGSISWEAFFDLMHNEVLIAYMATSGLEIHNVRAFFEILTGSRTKERVSVPTFIEKCMQMKGQASGIELRRVLFELRLLQGDVCRARKENQDFFQLVRSSRFFDKGVYHPRYSSV
jgi:hypothetical protein